MPGAGLLHEIRGLLVQPPCEGSIGAPAGVTDDARRRRHQLERDVPRDQTFGSALDIVEQRIERTVAAKSKAVVPGLDPERFLTREFAKEFARERMGVDVDDHSNSLRG